jgi:hypothetical protein
MEISERGPVCTRHKLFLINCRAWSCNMRRVRPNEISQISGQATTNILNNIFGSCCLTWMNSIAHRFVDSTCVICCRCPCWRSDRPRAPVMYRIKGCSSLDAGGDGEKRRSVLRTGYPHMHLYMHGGQRRLLEEETTRPARVRARQAVAPKQVYLNRITCS